MSVRHCLQCAWLFLRLFFALLTTHLIVVHASCQLSSACYRKCLACVWHGVGGHGTCLLCIGIVWETKYQLNQLVFSFFSLLNQNQENFQKLKVLSGAIWKWVQVHPFFQPNFLAWRKWQRRYGLLVYYYFVISFWSLGLFSCSDSSLLVMLMVLCSWKEWFTCTMRCIIQLIASAVDLLFPSPFFSFFIFFKWLSVWCHWPSFI